MKFNPLKRIEKKFKSHGLISSLALISIIGFSLNAYTIYTGQELNIPLAYASIILGMGLVLESQFIKALTYPTIFIREENEIAKIVTFSVGLLVLLGGLASSAIIGLQLSPEIMGAIGIGNVIALGVIIYELFWID